MTERAPSMDRLFAGLMAGAAVGAPMITVPMAVTSNLISDLWQFTSTLVLVFLLLALVMVLAQAPMWFLMRALRLPDWMAATIAGGLAFAIPLVWLMFAWADYVGSAPVAQNIALASYAAMTGIAAGFIAWRVTQRS